MSVMDRLQPNRAARRARAAALLAEAAGVPVVGDVVRIVREATDTRPASVDVVRVTDAFTTQQGIRMITVRTAPFGISTSTVRADAVLPDEAPDVRHDAVDCREDRCQLHRVEFEAARDNEREVW